VEVRGGRSRPLSHQTWSKPNASGLCARRHVDLRLGRGRAPDSESRRLPRGSVAGWPRSRQSPWPAGPNRSATTRSWAPPWHPLAACGPQRLALGCSCGRNDMYQRHRCRSSAQPSSSADRLSVWATAVNPASSARRGWCGWFLCHPRLVGPSERVPVTVIEQTATHSERRERGLPGPPLRAYLQEFEDRREYVVIQAAVAGVITIVILRPADVYRPASMQLDDPARSIPTDQPDSPPRPRESSVPSTLTT
jgi:hypothetical protein